MKKLYNVKTRISKTAILEIKEPSIINKPTLFSLKNNVGSLILEDKSKLKFGNKVEIGSGLEIYVSKESALEIYDDVVIGENFKCTVYKKVTIGSGSRIADNVCIRSFSGHLVNNKNDADEIFIGKKVWIGANVTILPGVKIGDGVIIGACSVVTKDIPARCLAVGNPAKVIKEAVVWGNNDYSLK